VNVSIEYGLKNVTFQWGIIKKSLQIFASFQVDPTGEVSNSFIEDYDAVLKFMNAEKQNRKLNR
jgi:hypothetical protein